MLLDSERRQPYQGLAEPHIETLGAYTTYMVAVCTGLRKGYGARVGALYSCERNGRPSLKTFFDNQIIYPLLLSSLSSVHTIHVYGVRKGVGVFKIEAELTS